MVLERKLGLRNFGDTLCISFYDSQINSAVWLRRGESLELVNIQIRVDVGSRVNPFGIVDKDT